jgi:hypothetical protein
MPHIHYLRRALSQDWQHLRLSLGRYQQQEGWPLYTPCDACNWGSRGQSTLDTPFTVPFFSLLWSGGATHAEL